MPPLLETILQDLRFAARTFRRTPIFTLTAIFVAALGIGSTTAVFSVVDRILFRSLPYPNEDRLVSIGMLTPLDTNEFIFPDAYFDLRRAPSPFESITSFTAGVVGCDLSETNPVRLGCAQVEGNFLPALGLAPVVGRNFLPQEDRRNAPPVALITHALWQGRFARDPGIAGRIISIDGRPVTIVGILPANFELPTLATADILFPEALNEATDRNGRALRVFAKLRPGASIPQTRAALQPLFDRALETVPPAFRKEVHFVIRSLRDRQVHDVRVASWVLLGSVIAVLLIACANIANLLLARSVSRRRELAVRVALGASRTRLTRQVLSETALLGVLGGAAGCVLAWALLRIFIGIAPAGIPRLEQASLDPRALLFALCSALISGLIFGLAPAFQNPDAETLAGARSTGQRSPRLRESLVAIQIAVSLVLLTGAGILLRSLWKLESVPLGLQSENVITAEFTLGKQRYAEGARQIQFFDELESRVRRIPGVTAVALTDSLPPMGAARGRPLAAIRAEGRPPIAEGTGGMVTWRYVTPGYFAVLGIPILRGRVFRDQDRAVTEELAIVSESLAHKLFPTGDAVGKHLDIAGPLTIVGIAADVKNLGPSDPSWPEYYVLRNHSLNGAFRNPMASSDGWRHGFVTIRTVISPRLMTSWITREFSALDPQLPLTIATMQQRVGKIAQRPRFNALLLAMFAGMGVLLACVGLYGVMSFLVSQRTPEIGIRMALGATPGQIMQLILSRATLWTASGTLLGLIGSIFATRALRSLLFEIPEHDPIVFGLAIPSIFLVTLAAAYLPARKAAQVNPITALR